MPNHVGELSLKAHELKKADRATELDQQVDIAIRPSFVTREGAKERQASNAESIQNGTTFAQRFHDISASE